MCSLEMVDATVVLLLSLLCACCHVDDVHSTYVNFIIIIIALNSNLLNNICHICHLVFCHTEPESWTYATSPENDSDVISFGSKRSSGCSEQHRQLYLYPNESVCRTFAHSFCLLFMFSSTLNLYKHLFKLKTVLFSFGWYAGCAFVCVFIWANYELFHA